MKLLISFLIFFVSLTATEFDNFVEKSLTEFQVPGAAIGVIVDGKVVLAKGYGSRNLKEGLPVTAETNFAIASTTKAFTALVMKQLVDEGKVGWDDPINKYLPEFQLKGGRSSVITIRDLLAHRTGYPRHDALWFCRDMKRSDVLKALMQVEPAYPVRQHWQYNNMMYTVAAAIIEKVTGQSWEDAIESRIFAPLSMSHSDTFVAPPVADANYSLPYAELNGNVKQISYQNVPAIAPGAGIHSNIHDLLRWVNFQLTDTSLNILHTSQITLSKRDNFGVTDTGYALGWFTGRYKGYSIIHHGGSLDGFITEICFLKDQKIGIIILTNSSSDGRFFASLIRNTLLDKLLHREKTPWAKIIQENRMQEKEAMQGELYARFSPMNYEKYLGTWTHPGYGSVEIYLKDANLFAKYGNLTLSLFPMEKDYFESEILPIRNLGARRILDFNFHNNELSIDFESAVSPIVFKKS